MKSTESLEKTAKELVTLNIKEVQELLDILKKKYNLEPPVAVATPTSKDNAEEKEEDKGVVDIIMKSFDASKRIAVIKAIRTVTGKGLVESKKLLDEKENVVIKSGVVRSEAQTHVDVMKNAGAVIELK